jgi:hypothetical protein
VSLKSTGHRNTGTEPEEVKEEPMVKAKAKSGANFFFTEVPTVLSKEATKGKVSRIEETGKQ